MNTLAPFLLLTFAIAVLGACFQPDKWYRRLAKPAWNPPQWMFTLIWTLLYVLIALAGWQAWESENAMAMIMLGLWMLQLFLSAAWPWLFFWHHRPDLAFVVVVALLIDVASFFALALFIRENLAAALFLPYLIWVGFAAMLNFSIWQMNRDGTPPPGSSAYFN